MQRTKKTRGAKSFQMRSGNSTPYSFLGGAVKGLKNVLSGNKGRTSAAGGAADMNTKIDEIHSALVGEEEGSTMMTKKAGPLYHNMHKGQSDPDHQMHTHHPNSPNHPDNLPKYYIEGEKGNVSGEHFSAGNYGMVKEKKK